MINFIDYKFLFYYLFNIKFKTILTTTNIKRLEIKQYNTSEYTIIQIYIINKGANDLNKLVLILKKVYIINNLVANTLISINIFKFKKIVFNLITDIIMINLY